jgi:hypothetical protein
MTQISKTAQDALSVYEGSLDGYSIVEPARIEALAKTAESTYSAPIEISPLAPEVTPHPLLETVSSSPAIHDTINVSVSADTAEEDLRDLERKINRILQEQVNRYYGSPRI